MSVSKLSTPQFILMAAIAIGGQTAYRHYRSAGVVAAPEMSAVDKMQIAFVGDHTADQVEQKMVDLLARYQLSSSDMEHSASVLVLMRKDTNVPELQIADCMLGLRQPGFNWQLPAAAAYCATGFSLQRR